MDTFEVILLVAVFMTLGFSLYKKYMKKDQGRSSRNEGSKSNSLFTSHSHAKDDDYEPYSGK